MKIATFLSFISLSCLFVSEALVAQETVEDGYYVGERKNQSDEEIEVEVYIKNILGSPFGLLVERTQKPAIGLFKIELHPDQTQMWIPISKDSKAKKLTQDEDYAVTFSVTRKSKGLKFTPMVNAQNCRHYDFTATRSEDKEWKGELSAKSETFKSDHGSKVEVTFNSETHLGSMNGTLMLGDRRITGEMTLEEQLPGISTLRATQKDLTSSDGQKLAPNIEALTVLIRDPYVSWGREKFTYELLVSQGSAVKLSCLQTAEVLERD